MGHTPSDALPHVDHQYRCVQSECVISQASAAGCVDNGPAEAARTQQAHAAAEGTAALPVDNGDVGNHVAEGKGTGLEAAADAAAEQEEAIKDAKSSGLTLSSSTECMTSSKEDTVAWAVSLVVSKAVSEVSIGHRLRVGTCGPILLIDPAAPDEDRPEEAAPVAAPAAPAPSAKAKRKAALSKANAEGPKGTLLDAFTGPPPTAVEPQAEPMKEMPKQMPSPAASPPASAPEKVILLRGCLHLTIRLGNKVPGSACRVSTSPGQSVL